MNYGLGYMGSKSRICDELFNYFPSANNFYDLFCGGCAVTHKAILSKKYRHIIFNDIAGDVSQLFLEGIRGKYHNEKRWISREDFFKYKDTDGFIRICWSFGNIGKCYMYDKDLEPYKKACHYAIVFDEWEQLKKLCPEVWEVAYNAIKDIKNIKQRRLKFSPAIVKELKRLNNWEIVEKNPLYKSCHWRGGKLDGKQNDLQSLERLERLQSLERLERLQSLERLERLQSLERLERLQKNYFEVEIEPNSVIYCDIPYKDTAEYSVSFAHEAFYNWARKQKELVLISEYSMPEDFICIKEIPLNSTLQGGGATKRIEKLFIPKHQLELYKSQQPQPSLFDDMF